MAERCGLFVIIALGESILITGATFADLPWTTETMAAFLAAFLGSVAMWWLYFNIGAERASRQIRSSGDPGRIARVTYTYVHLLLVAGIVVSAVADELVLKYPHGHADGKTIAVSSAARRSTWSAICCSSGPRRAGRHCHILQVSRCC